jgi:hypothetical protein
MSSNKRSFLLHIDSLDVLDDLTDEECGMLFKAIRAYQTGDEIELSGLVRVAFSPFRNQFNRDDDKYNLTCKRRAEAGSKGGKQKVANASNSKQKVANVAENDSKNKNKSDNKSDNYINPLAQSKIDREKLVTEAFVYFWSNMKLPKKARPIGEKSFVKAVKAFDDPLHFANFLVRDTETRFNNQQIGFDKMHPSTYLNQTRWEDDHTIDKTSSTKPSIAGDGTDWRRFESEML